MRTLEECNKDEQDEIMQLVKYGNIIRDDNNKEFEDPDERWEEQFQLIQVIKNKILDILGR